MRGSGASGRRRGDERRGGTGSAELRPSPLMETDMAAVSGDLSLAAARVDDEGGVCAATEPQRVQASAHRGEVARLDVVHRSFNAGTASIPMSHGGSAMSGFKCESGGLTYDGHDKENMARANNVRPPSGIGVAQVMLVQSGHHDDAMRCRLMDVGSVCGQWQQTVNLVMHGSIWNGGSRGLGAL